MTIMCAVKNSSCSNLSCSVVNAVVVFVSCLFWELHIPWVVVLTVNPSVYVELITYISEWLAAFSFVLSFYLVSFDDAVDTVTQMCHKVQQHYIMQHWFRTYCGACNSVFLHEPSSRFFILGFHSGE